MARIQSLRLRAYSFSFRKWRSRLPDCVFPLNTELCFPLKEGEGQIKYSCALDLFKDFIDAHTNINDAEDSQLLIRCQFDPQNQGEEDPFRYLFFSVFSGYYGYPSELVDRITKNVVHEKTVDQADVKQFYVIVVIPKDTELEKATRGLIFFQEIGVYGIKTITTKLIQQFFSAKLGLTFRDQNLAPDFYLKKLFENGSVKKIKLARNSQSGDKSDRLYGSGFGREERVLTPFSITKKMERQLRHVAKSNYHFYTFDGQNYPETKMVVDIGGRVRTIDLHALEELSVEEILPEDLLSKDGAVDFDRFKSIVLDIATEYLDHLPHNF